MFECLPACCMHACRLRPPCSACSSAPRGAPPPARSATLLSCSPPVPGHGWRARPLHPRAPVADAPPGPAPNPNPAPGAARSNQAVEHFLPVQLLGCARLAHVELAGCRSVHLPPVLGELPALTSVVVRDAKARSLGSANHPLGSEGWPEQPTRARHGCRAGHPGALARVKR